MVPHFYLFTYLFNGVVNQQLSVKLMSSRAIGPPFLFASNNNYKTKGDL